jgi:hypothetical protein
MVMEAAGRLKEKCPGAEVRIPLSGPFSIACALVGFQEILIEVLTNPDTVAAALRTLAVSHSRLQGVSRHVLRVLGFSTPHFPGLVQERDFSRASRNDRRRPKPHE